MLEQLNKQRQKVSSLVENRVHFAAKDVELSIYDTYENAEHIRLCSSEVLFCGMLTGKKVMHVNSCDYHKPFLPNESFVLAPKQAVYIDFPTACLDKPTTCLAIEISKDKITSVADKLNYEHHAHQQNYFEYHSELVHNEHNAQTQQLLNRLILLFSENDPQRAFYIDLALNELVARLLQQQSRDFLFKQISQGHLNTGIHAAIVHMQKDLSQHLDIEQLSKIACMSRSKFFEQFKTMMGTTPQQWLHGQKLMSARNQLKQGQNVTSVAFSLGFSHPSQLSRSFKKAFNQTPKQYQTQHINRHQD
ncbi:AraC family transcriptional regulator N-terminal domain-containing protein [Pseudoalteromonas luteoviolacea]|uniref:helix-turn-helix domain-containing protein n=1 Tax=Pseudoalteromonas luteoviolacea TaxID=43657 RepID=UPI001B3825FF|nr:helix-turn-helix domain-containing protein [Pseudoalteromonas luteoviolacea]MBQ4810888.1 AraC family transcriptional regulator N-terminal domain-containing protein [Pseudoalteromonas luteoviolacea]